MMSRLRPSAGQAIGLVLSALIAVVLLEVGLRAGGLLFLAFQEGRNQLSLRQEETYRILCIGESTTAYGGRQSYPSQLERLLNERANGVRFSVINKGIPNTNTDVILSQLAQNLDRYRPHVVVAMMGFNDYYAAEADRVGVPLLRSLRIYKLLRMALHAARGDTFLASPATVTSVAESEDVLWDRLRANPRDLDALEALAGRRTMRPAAAEAMLQAVLAAQPDDAHAHFAVARLHQGWGERDEAKAALQNAIRLAPQWKDPKQNLAILLSVSGQETEAYRLIREVVAAGQGDAKTWMCLRAMISDDLDKGRIEEAKAKLDDAFALLPADADETRAHLLEIQGRLLRMLGDEAGADTVFRRAEAVRGRLVRTRTERNYLEVVRVLAARGIPLIAVQYPVRPLEPLREMLGSQTGVVFVDNERTFRDALRGGRYEEYFIDSVGGNFGHTTPRGAHLLAENVAAAVLRLLRPAR